MKNYKIPNAEFVRFDIEDVITASGVIVDANELTGEDLIIFKEYYKNSAIRNSDVTVIEW